MDVELSYSLISSKIMKKITDFITDMGLWRGQHNRHAYTSYLTSHISVPLILLFRVISFPLQHSPVLTLACVKMLVTQSCPALCDPMDYIAHQALLSMRFSGKNTRVGSHSLLQGTFLTQALNPGLLLCRWLLYHLSHQGSPMLAYIKKKKTSFMSFDKTMGYLNLQYPHPQKTCSIMQISKRKNRKDFEVLCFPLSPLPAFVTRRKPYRCINRFSSDLKYVTPIPLERQILL